tara:strand:- start:17243 stop:17863 length:621 start_codon:yes stop_codon:yes gene_type:complete
MDDIDCIFRETYEMYEKNLKQAIQSKLIKLYRELSSRYTNMIFTDFSKNCQYVNEDKNVEIPNILNEREYDNREYSDCISAMLKHTYTRIDKVICRSLERIHRENKGIIDLKSNIDLIQDTHKKSRMNGILCLGITNRGTICSQLAVRNIGKFQFCKKCAKNATVDVTPVKTCLKYTHNVTPTSTSEISNGSEHEDDNPLPFDTTY